MSKPPYFTTADGVAVKGNDRVHYIGLTCIHVYQLYRGRCARVIRVVDKKDIFSTRAAAQAECDKRNSV